MEDNNIYNILDKRYFETRKGKMGYVFWDGTLVSAWGQKVYRIHCPDCLNSDNPTIRDFAENYKFTVAISNLNGRPNLPCGCSSRIEALGIKYGKDFMMDYEFKYQDSTITVKERVEFNGSLKRKIECSTCSIDKELFPEDLVTTSSNIIKGIPNCGCNTNYRKSEHQIRVLCKRKALEGGYRFLGFKQKYVNKNSKCIIDCPEHGEWSSCSVDNFIRDRGCPDCGQLRRNSQNGNRNGFYKERGKEKDYLYIVIFKDYLKIGRSFSPVDRIRSLKSDSRSEFKLTIHTLYTGSHTNVYEVEQSLHKELRKLGKFFKTDWTKESFTLDSLSIALSYLEKSCLELEDL